VVRLRLWSRLCGVVFPHIFRRVVVPGVSQILWCWNLCFHSGVTPRAGAPIVSHHILGESPNSPPVLTPGFAQCQFLPPTIRCNYRHFSNQHFKCSPHAACCPQLAVLFRSRPSLTRVQPFWQLPSP